MKSILRSILINFIGLIIISKLTQATSFNNSFYVLFSAAFVLSLLNMLVKPILNLILMPINALTLGAFRWVINIIVLFMVTLLVPHFQIVNYNFPGLTLAGFTIPAIRFSFFWALFLVSFMLEIVTSFIFWLFK